MAASVRKSLTCDQHFKCCDGDLTCERYRATPELRQMARQFLDYLNSAFSLYTKQHGNSSTMHGGRSCFKHL